MEPNGKAASFSYNGSRGGEHAGLIYTYAEEIRDFLTGTTKAQSALVKASGAPAPETPNQLFITIRGRTEPWILNPQQAGAGISPLSGAYSNGWALGKVEVGAGASSFVVDDPLEGFYQGKLTAPAGETLSLQVQFLRAGQLQATNLNWIGGSNDIGFRVQLAPTETNALTLASAVPSPQKLGSFPSEGNCSLTWEPLADTNVVAYRVYARREDESLFAPLATTTNILCNTGHAWVSSIAGTNWFYAVVAIAAGGDESPYADTVMNSAPTLARFTADLQSGTPPLSVTFTSQSLGGVTNWAWDFDSDGTIDSTEQNPSTIFTEEGSYTVTLTVSGPDGADTLVAVGFISVSKPVLSARRFLPNHTMELGLSAQAGRNFEIQATTNFWDWTILTNLLTTNVTTIFTDPSATNYDQRFYRGVIP